MEVLWQELIDFVNRGDIGDTARYVSQVPTQKEIQTVSSLCSSNIARAWWLKGTTSTRRKQSFSNFCGGNIGNRPYQDSGISFARVSPRLFLPVNTGRLHRKACIAYPLVWLFCRFYRLISFTLPPAICRYPHILPPAFG
ncbi:MAG: hypothetical protein KAJ40_01220 [Alphaproteobacteria bacterium]|nr:hypothetical protein [Alphaproteobacteria bacterium]